MYQYPYPPPPDVYAQALQIAQRLAAKKEKKEQREKDAKKKAEADEKKRAEESKSRTLLGLEWFILGILSYPIVGPLYHIAINHMEVFSHVK